jgi:hypothetical protein
MSVMINKRGQSLPEFVVIMSALAALGAYLSWTLLFKDGGKGAIAGAQNIATDKIAAD